MTASLEGRFALVTGASSDIGQATVIALAAADTIVHAVLSPASANIDLIEIGPDGQF